MVTQGLDVKYGQQILLVLVYSPHFRRRTRHKLNVGHAMFHVSCYVVNIVIAQGCILVSCSSSAQKQNPMNSEVESRYGRQNLLVLVFSHLFRRPYSTGVRPNSQARRDCCLS